MWFLATTTKTPKFFLANGSTVEADIDWTHEKVTLAGRIWSGDPVVESPAQAIAALNAKGAVSFKTKPEAKEFAKTLPAGGWKYYRIK